MLGELSVISGRIPRSSAARVVIHKSLFINDVAGALFLRIRELISVIKIPRGSIPSKDKTTIFLMLLLVHYNTNIATIC